MNYGDEQRVFEAMCGCLVDLSTKFDPYCSISHIFSIRPPCGAAALVVNTAVELPTCPAPEVGPNSTFWLPLQLPGTVI